jgi:hypothetical protein
MLKAYEWKDVLGWDDNGKTQSRANWIVVAKTLEDALDQICNSARFTDDPARIRAISPSVRELPELTEKYRKEGLID